MLHALLVIGLTLVGMTVAAQPSAAAAVPISGASLTWKVSAYAFGDAGTNSLTQTQAVSGNVTKESDGWVFTGGTGTYDAATGATTVTYTGSIDLGNTGFGNFAIRIANPVVTVATGGAGTVTADVAVRQSGAASFDPAVAGVELVTIDAVPNATTWTVTPPWTGVGTEGSISTGVPYQGQQFSQAFLDALPSAMRSFFYATSATGSNLNKPPAPITINLKTTPQPVLAASLTWKVSAYAFGDAGTNSLTQTQAVSGNVTKESDGWVFTGGTGTYDAATGATTVTYTGSIDLGNTGFGNFAIRIANPVVTVATGGAGTVTADVAVRQSGAASFDPAVAGVELVTIDAVPNATTWTVTPPWTGVGTEGSISTGVPYQGQQFSQAFLDALPSAMRSFFYATSATGSNLNKPPAPITINLTDTSGGGSGGGGGSIPTPPYSGNLGGGSGIPAVSAPSTARPVVSGSLDWGVKASFRSYITGGIANGAVTASNGASSNGDGTYRFAATGGSWDPATNSGVLLFGGSVRFTGHSGALDVTVSNPQLHFTGGGNVLYADLSSKSLTSGATQSYSGAMGTIGGSPTLSGDTLSWSGLGVSLTGDAAPAFAGFYTAGEGLDSLSGSDTLGPAAASAGTTGTAEAGAGAGAGSGAGTGTGSGTGVGTGGASGAGVFTPPAGSTNPTKPVTLGPGVVLVSQAVAKKTDETPVGRPAAARLAKAPLVKVDAGEVVQPRITGLPKRIKTTVFIVIGGKRVGLAALTSDKAGRLTLPALQVKKKGTFNVGVVLPNGSVRWIKIRTS